MSYSVEYKEHIEYMFNAFCKVILRNAALGAYRDFGRKQKHEVSLDYLLSDTPFEPFTTDNYWKLESLKKLRKELEETDYEE